MAMLKKLKSLNPDVVLTQKETNYVKGGLWVDSEKGKSHGCPPPFDEQ